MYHDPPAWTYFVSPLVSLLAVVIAYLLGNMQGQAQTRYDRATEALTKILALALEAEDYLLTLCPALSHNPPDTLLTGNGGENCV